MRLKGYLQAAPLRLDFLLVGLHRVALKGPLELELREGDMGLHRLVAGIVKAQNLTATVFRTLPVGENDLFLINLDEPRLLPIQRFGSPNLLVSGSHHTNLDRIVLLLTKSRQRTWLKLGRTGDGIMESERPSLKWALVVAVVVVHKVRVNRPVLQIQRAGPETAINITQRK